jgi:hypothetical protein
MGEECNTRTKSLFESMKETDHLENLKVDGIILKGSFGK